MIVDEGKLRLQDYQATSLATCEWALFENDEEITNATVVADLTEPGWVGYARVTVGAMEAAAMVGTRAQAVPSTMPTWTNGDGGPVSIFGWALIDPSDETLLNAENIGELVIPDGATYVLAPGITDTQE